MKTIYYIHFTNHTGRLDTFSGSRTGSLENAIKTCKEMNCKAGVSRLDNNKFITVFQNYESKLELLPF